MSTFNNLLSRALIVMNERLKDMNTASRLGSLFRDIMYYLQNFVLGIILKGEKANETEIKAISDAKRGDTWKATDTGHYWCYDGNGWNDIGSILPDNIATREELATKAPIVNPQLKYTNNNKAVNVDGNNRTVIYHPNGQAAIQTWMSNNYPAMILQALGSTGAQSYLDKNLSALNFPDSGWAFAASFTDDWFGEKGAGIFYLKDEIQAMHFNGKDADKDQMYLQNLAKIKLLYIDKDGILKFDIGALAQTLGTSKELPVSQNLLSDYIHAFNSDLNSFAALLVLKANQTEVDALSAILSLKANQTDVATKAPIVNPQLKYTNNNKAVNVDGNNRTVIYHPNGQAAIQTWMSNNYPAMILQALGSTGAQTYLDKNLSALNLPDSGWAFAASFTDDWFGEKGVGVFYLKDEIQAMHFNGKDADKDQMYLQNLAKIKRLYIDKDGIINLSNPQLKYTNSNKAVNVDGNNRTVIYHPNGQAAIQTWMSNNYPAMILQALGSTGAQTYLDKNLSALNFPDSGWAFAASFTDDWFGEKGAGIFYLKDEIQAMHFNGMDADKDQMYLQNLAKTKLISIDKNGVLHIAGVTGKPLSRYEGKTILFIGDSIMNGYPQSNINMLPAAKEEEFSYPIQVCKLLGANCINSAMPGAAIRKGDIRGNDNVWTKARTLSRTIAEAQALFPQEGTNRSDAIKFSYENSVLPYVNDSNVIFFGFGANDVELDKLTDTTFMPESEFVKFDPNDPYNVDKFPINTRNRNSYIGATNYVIDEILKVNPKAYFCFIGHFSMDDAQSNSDQHVRLNRVVEGLAAYWGVPLLKLWEKTGWIKKDGNNSLNLFCPDGIHFNSDASKAGLNKIVAAVERFILNDVLEN